MRFVPPRQSRQSANRSEFYEVLLKAPGGILTLQRFAWSDDQLERKTPMPLLFTHEVLLRLTDNLESIVMVTE